MSMKVTGGGGNTTSYQESQPFGSQGTRNATGYGSITQGPATEKNKEPNVASRAWTATKRFFTR